jgi:uncharacterized membrane protein HdeD (DUF308 family)
MSTFGTTSGQRGPLGTVRSATWQVLLVAGLVAVALGIIILAWPSATLAVIGTIFGIYLLVSGLAQIVAAFAAALPTALRVIGFISGALSVLLGLICFRGPLQSVFLLALWIGFSWLFRGVGLAAGATSDPAVPARGWQIFLGIGVAIAGVVLIVSPFASLTALTLVAGAWLIVVGVMELIAAVRAHASGHPGRHVPAGA